MVPPVRGDGAAAAEESTLTATPRRAEAPAAVGFSCLFTFPPAVSPFRYLIDAVLRTSEMPPAAKPV